jgi:hypothetical protein
VLADFENQEEEMKWQRKKSERVSPLRFSSCTEFGQNNDCMPTAKWFSECCADCNKAASRLPPVPDVSAKLGNLLRRQLETRAILMYNDSDIHKRSMQK